jgi:hypothetical protein
MIEEVVFYYGTRRELDHYLRIGGLSAGWLSTNPEWDPCGQGVDNTGRLLSKQEMLEWGSGLVRITVPADAAPHTLGDWTTRGFADQNQKKNFDLAIAGGSRPGDWRFTKRGMRMDAWLAVDIDVGAGWVPFEGFPPKAASL